MVLPHCDTAHPPRLNTLQPPVTDLRAAFAKGAAWTTAEKYNAAIVTFFFTAWMRLARSVSVP
jgi:hypothetical protein